MTAGELKQIFQKAGVNTDDKGELNKVLSGSNNGHRTQAILASNRTGAGFENNPASDVRGTQPIWNSVLSDAGVDVNAVNNATEYLLSSINSGNTAHIAVRFEKSFENYADDELLTGAVVFVSPANGSASKVEERGFSYEQRSSSGS